MLIFIGPAGSGKTTIETSLYQLFQKSSVGGYYFAGSNTIQAYESRSFYTRIRSKEIVPSTQNI
ncbi:MAG: TRAFAC clade GTPase domain-containing protein [Clostridioides difficile]